MKKNRKLTGLGQGLLKGLKEAIDYESKKIDLRNTSSDLPDNPPEFSKVQVKKVRETLNVSQPIFAKILGVSPGTVKAWELGSNVPQGSSARLIQMAQRDPNTFKQMILKKS